MVRIRYVFRPLSEVACDRQSDVWHFKLDVAFSLSDFLHLLEIRLARRGARYIPNMRIDELTPEELATLKAEIFRDMAVKSNKKRAGTLAARASARYAAHCRWDKERAKKMAEAL